MKTSKASITGFISRSCLLCAGVLALTAWNIDGFERCKHGTEPPLRLELQPDVTDLSIIQLIATPERYHGKVVRIVGFVRLEFEGNAIYLHQEDLKHGLTTNGLWLSVTDEIEKRADKYSDKYVLVEGTFNSHNKGHMEMNSGAIENIKRLEVWPRFRDE